MSVTDISRHPTAGYAMAQGPGELLLEIFQPNPHAIPPELHDCFNGGNP